MKKILITITVVVAIAATLIGLKLFRWGWMFSTEISPDGQHRVELRQVIHDLRLMRHLGDSDTAEGWILLTDHNGKVLRKTYDKQLTFVIVIWRGSSVEIQSSGADKYEWKLDG